MAALHRSPATSADAQAVTDPRRIVAVAIATGALLIIGIVAGARLGTVDIPFDAFLEAILPPWRRAETGASVHEIIVLELRLPRVALIAVIGASLACAGTAYQGLFRNPLADPYLVGVAPGAGLGATLVLSLGLPATPLGMAAVPAGAFVGGVVTVIVVLAMAHVGRTTPIATLLLAGVAVGAFCQAATTFWMLRSPEGLRRAFTWLLGGYGGGGWLPVWIVAIYAAVGYLVLRSVAVPLNALQLDEAEARHLGVDVERVKLITVAAATIMTAAAVAFGGLIGFVGLVVPHMQRLLAGPDHRRLFPLAAAGGAAFLLFADLVARTLLSPQELPVGVITALTGAPFFLFLLRRVRVRSF